jgi:thiol:disulfide interchange protein DsbD
MSIGAGMALPYLVLTTNPAFMKWIPRPGEWTKTFESIMGLLLVFTTIYLLGLLEPEKVMPSVTLIGFIATGLWQYGEYGAINRKRLWRLLSAAMLVIIITGGYFISFKLLYQRAPHNETSKSDFRVSRMIENRDSKKISVINFTAEWCPNCKLVERATLGRENVKEVLADERIDFMVADITTSNPAAERLMALFGSRSIPLLAVVPPGSGFNQPIILRDIYSSEEVLRAINEAEKYIMR